MLPNRADVDTYGGPKKNYGAVVDPETDEASIYRNRYVIDTAGMTHTVPIGYFSFQGVNGANPIDPPSGFTHDAVYGNANPSYKPAIVRFAEGVYDATLPASVVQAGIYSEAAEDGGGETASLNVRRAEGWCECSDGTLRHVRCERTGANTVRIRCWTNAGALDDFDGQIVTVVFW